MTFSLFNIIKLRKPPQREFQDDFLPVYPVFFLSLSVLFCIYFLFGFTALLLFISFLIVVEIALKNILKINKYFDSYSDDKVILEKKIISDPPIAYIAPDENLSWKNKPDHSFIQNIRITELGKELKWSCSTDSKGCRVTSHDINAHDNKPSIMILGCSLTFGCGLNNEDTYPWLLQERFEDYSIKNYGVSAYSLYQMSLVLEKNIGIEKPKVVVLGFHNLLEIRNVNLLYRRHLLTQFKNPSCLVRNGKIKKYAPSGYRKILWADHINLLKILEFNINKVRFVRHENRKMIRSTTEYLLLKIRKVCKENNAKLLVACVDYSEPYYDFFVNNGFLWCITGVNRHARNEDGSPKWTLFPFDNHPTKETNRVYASVIGEALENLLDKKYVTPDPRLVRIHEKETEPELLIYPHF